MALTFPANPTNGQIYDQYVYDATAQSWRVYGSDTGITNVLATKANLSGGNTFSGSQVFSSFISNPNNPAFYAQGSGTVVMSGAARFEYISFSSAPTNIGGYFNTSNSRFTAPIAGTYYFWLQAATTDATSTGPEIFIFKNGSSVNNVAISYNSAFYNTFGAAYIIDLQANDFVQHAVQNNNGTTFTLERGRSRFAGYLIG